MLKINLLPRSEIVGPINKKLLVVVVVALGAWIAFWMFAAAGVQKQIQEVEKRIEEVRPTAQKVDSLTAELNSKQAELAPIAAKVKFVEEADRSGEPWWDRFHKIKKYIPAYARVTSFVLTNNSVEFNVTVKGTTQFARFVINLLRCPHITGVTLGGLGPGRGLPSGEPPEPGEWPTGRGQPLTASMAALTGGGGVQTAPTGMPGGGPAGMPGPMGPPGMGAPGGTMGPPPMGPPGPASGPPGMGGMGPMGSPGGMPGMPGMGGARGASSGGTTDPENEEITFTVRAQLVEPIQTPQPPGAAGGAGAGAGMPGFGGAGMPGMGGAGMPGMGGGGMPGMSGPPGAGGPPGAAGMGPPSPGPGGAGGGGKAGGGEE